MADENEPVLDLLGDPWIEPKDRRGRKRHRRLPQVAETVAILKATGSTDEDIADRIGISIPTLKKYYFSELSNSVTLTRQVLIAVMWKKALEGNVSAAKFIDEKFAKGELEEFLTRQQAEPGSKATPPPAPAPRGKKEAAHLAAQTAGQGSEWGDDLAFDHSKH